jgi:hypothetical protein
MQLDDLIEMCTDRGDEIPHLALVGGTGSGKTTLVVALLGMREGDIAALSGKEEDQFTKWRGLKVVGLDDDLSYEPCITLFDQLLWELKRRNLAVKRRLPIGDILTVVIDDLGVLRKECPSAINVVKYIARIGRSLKVRLIILSGSGQVKELGLEGEGETRDHFLFIKLSKHRSGVVEAEGEKFEVDFSDILAEHAATDLTGREWIPANYEEYATREGEGETDVKRLVPIIVSLVAFVTVTLMAGIQLGAVVALGVYAALELLRKKVETR